MPSAALSASPGRAIPIVGPDPTSHEMLAVEDDAHCERATAAGPEITRDIENAPYGSREYSARDLDGHTWSFGTYRAEPAA